MKVLKIALPILAVLVVLLIALLPIGPVPGFIISGIETDVPETWGDTSAIHEIKLKVGASGLPRVVIIWVIQFENDLYVVGANESGWVSMIGNGGPVQLAMKDKTYTLNATRVTTEWEAVLEAYQNKYRPDYPEIINGFPTLDEAKETTSVFKLSKY
jgi:hypothetical protein